MSTASGPSLVKDGLILNLDFASSRSNKGRRSIIKWNEWVAGGTGGTASYGQNGDGNSRINDINPWGDTDIVWDVSNQDAISDADGGWSTSTFPIDTTKLYRYSVWMKRKVIGNGSSYLGPHSNWGNTVGEYILNRSNNAENINPYWRSSAWWGNANEWYLIVGHVFPAGSGTGSLHSDSGVYDLAGTKVASVNDDFVWAPTNTFSFHRSYLYYSTDTLTNQQFYQPRVDVCDGTQPTISELLNNVGNYLYDTSLYNNHHSIINNPNITTSAVLNGSTDGLRRMTSLSGVTANCTVVIWYSTTDTQELWVMGNNDGATYLSASYGNNYYHGNCGTPINYVDLKTVVNPETPVDYRNGAFHMWEAKGVNFNSWNRFDWFLYPGNWQMAGTVNSVLVYNRVLTAAESSQNFNALRSRFSI